MRLKPIIFALHIIFSARTLPVWRRFDDWAIQRQRKHVMSFAAFPLMHAWPGRFCQKEAGRIFECQPVFTVAPPRRFCGE
ncbi:hypothetical protein B0J12DRAFT_683200 [Macrophomina phaseolina]|uniref:Secreted protein n=1 Tax=Macrophomina phaseolina TaxID=35725 RepID=A0ABQ8FV80_9PEZI|nr:hypothetical protein B0J12DRAFT_683200 [Macrophomina phaseolina]